MNKPTEDVDFIIDMPMTDTMSVNPGRFVQRSWNYEYCAVCIMGV